MGPDKVTFCNGDSSTPKDLSEIVSFLPPCPERYPMIRVHTVNPGNVNVIADFKIIPNDDDPEFVQLVMVENNLPKCRNRKRFIRLVAGWFGIQRNEAILMTQLVRRHGSYQGLWERAYEFMVNYAVKRTIDAELQSN